MSHDNATNDHQGSACPACGGAAALQDVPVTFWIGAMLQMVENVPARVCTGCGARHYDETTERRLSALIAAGAPGWKAKRVVSVPVFDYHEIGAMASGLLGGGDAVVPGGRGPGAEDQQAAGGATDPTAEENTRY